MLTGASKYQKNEHVPDTADIKSVSGDPNRPLKNKNMQDSLIAVWECAKDKLFFDKMKKKNSAWPFVRMGIRSQLH